MSESPDEDKQRKSNEPTFDLDLDETGQKLPRSSHEIKEEDEVAMLDCELDDQMCQDAQRRYELRQEYHDDAVKVPVESIKEDEQKELHEVKSTRRELTDEENAIDHPRFIHAADLQKFRGYQEGFLVWAEKTDDLWWPGKVLDLTDGSGRICVVLFESGSILWNSTKQVRPFVSNFNDLSTRHTSQSFIAALEKAVLEVSRFVSDSMECGCIRKESRPEAGINLEPGSDSLTTLSIQSYEARNVVSGLEILAKTMAVSFESDVEFGVLRGWLQAFRRFRARKVRDKGKTKFDGPTRIKDKGKTKVVGPTIIKVTGLKKNLIYGLVINYDPSCPLPSFDSLVSDFCKFGSLRLTETKLIVYRHMAFVVFKKFTDCERAFKSLISRSEGSYDIMSVGNYYFSRWLTDWREITQLGPPSDMKEASFAVVLKFSESFPLPSKEQLVQHYAEYGTLNTELSHVFIEVHSAMVVYNQATECEAAFKSTISGETPFEVVTFANYWIRRF